jgi:hypothetical protein
MSCTTEHCRSADDWINGNPDVRGASWRVGRRDQVPNFGIGLCRFFFAVGEGRNEMKTDAQLKADVTEELMWEPTVSSNDQGSKI